MTIPIALIATVGSGLSLVFEDAVYGRETANWAAQSVGQDVANLVAFPAMAIAAWLAARGSKRGYLIWLGLVAYSAYTYSIYAFSVHFGPLFLAWVAVLGLSIYALIGAFTSMDVRAMQGWFSPGNGERFASRLLVAIGSVFTLLWLSEIVPPMLAGDAPDTLNEVGLTTNPVHVLDLAVLLPALVIAGVLLGRRRPIGYVLAPMLLVATFFLATGIVSLMLVSAARGIGGAPSVGAGMAVLALVEAVAAIRLLRRIEQRA